ncbi:MAG: flavodoxin domain-containing protein [Bacillota bacterium]
MKTIVIYKSKTGFVKRYAEWIARELSADIFEASRVTPDQFAAYDTVIYGGGLYAAGINGIKLITLNLDRLKGKKVVIFASGASPATEEAINDVINKNFTAGQLKQIRFFYLRGGFDYSKLKLVDKILMTLLKWKLKRKKDLTPDEKGMLHAYEKPVDFTNQKNIKDLIAYVRQ